MAKSLDPTNTEWNASLINNRGYPQLPSPVTAAPAAPAQPTAPAAPLVGSPYGFSLDQMRNAAKTTGQTSPVMGPSALDARTSNPTGDMYGTTPTVDVTGPTPTNAQWNNAVPGMESPGQADQDIINKKSPVYSAGYSNKPAGGGWWSGPDGVKHMVPATRDSQATFTNPDGTTQGYYRQSDMPSPLTGQRGSVSSISSAAMSGLSPETSRALSAARAAAADRGDFEAVSNSYGGNFAGGQFRPQAPTLQSPLQDQMSAVREQLNQVSNDTSMTGRMRERELSARMLELGKLEHDYAGTNIQQGQLGVQQGQLGVQQAMVPIHQMSAEAQQSQANTSFMAHLPEAEKQSFINDIIRRKDIKGLTALAQAQAGKTGETLTPGAIHLPTSVLNQIAVAPFMQGMPQGTPSLYPSLPSIPPKPTTR
jgi:hypothetical protein